MARIGRAIPASLAFLVLGAHFFRAAEHVLTTLCVAAAVLCFVRRAWIVITLRAGLVLGAVLWVHTALVIRQDRIQAGRPYVRMLVILGAVAAFTAFTAWLLPSGARDSRS